MIDDDTVCTIGGWCMHATKKRNWTDAHTVSSISADFLLLVLEACGLSQ